MLQKTKIASPLSRKATLAKMEKSKWTARKLDRKVTKKVNAEHGASADAARVNKLLIESKRMEKINDILTQVTNLFHSMTKPWSEGVGILPNVLHTKFVNEFRTLERAFDDAADEFARDYKSFIDERAGKLAGMFDPNDYPHPNQIRSKFKLKVRYFPVPEADDFRSDVLDTDTIEDIKREIAEGSNAVLDDAMADTKDKLVEVISHMSERLAGYTGTREGSFRDTLVENVRELAELLPAFNFNDDPKYDALVKRVLDELCTEDAKTLRDNKDVREAVKKSADDILKDVESLLG